MLPFPTRFNYADLLLLKDFLHSPLDFPVKSDGSCFPNLGLPINEEILTPHLSEVIEEQAAERRRHGRLPCQAAGGTGTARKGTSATGLAQKGPTGFSAG